MNTTGSTEEDIDGETALRRSTVLERVTEGIVALDTDLRYTYVNDRAEQILDADREQLIGERVWDAFPEARYTVAQKKIEAAMATQKQQSFERYNAERDRWFEVRVYPDDSGLSLYFTDITERKQQRRTLEKNRQRAQSLFEKLPDSVVVHDVEGDILDVNDQTVNDLGYSREELLSMNVTDFEVGVDADELRTTWAEMEVGERDKGSGRHRRKDGSTFPVEVWVDKVEIGGDEQFIALSRDVTEQRRNERKLEALTEEYHALLDSADDAIFLLDVDEAESDVEIRFERLNPYHEAATGLTTEDVRGKTPREALGPELGAELEANYRRCVEAQEPIAYQETLSFPEGTKTWETKLAPVVIDGEVTRIVGIARDVTDRVEREEALRRQNERLDEFAGVVAHDLRNPLNIAQGRTTLAVEELEREGYESPHLQKAQEALGRMEDIIMDTLVLARRGEEVQSMESVPIADLAGQCWDMVETDGASLVVVDECTIAGDPDRLQHVCENLFRNAIEHGDDDVTVRIGRADGSTLYVEDDGPGIPPERREAVFEPGETSREDGTGFGLAIVKRIAEAHGWEITLEDAEGGGARFEFTGVEVVS